MPNRDSLLRRSGAAVVVETDMRMFEGALDEDWCHLLGLPCGARRGPRTRPHVGWMDLGLAADGNCAGCQRRACPDCLRIARERGEDV